MQKAYIYSLDNELIKRYSSVAEAAKLLNTNRDKVRNVFLLIKYLIISI